MRSRRSTITWVIMAGLALVAASCAPVSQATGNLDTAAGDTILGLFDELRDDGLTLIVVTHDHAISEHADRIGHPA